MTDIAITAMTGVFPGPAGAVSIEQFGTNILHARRAALRPLQPKWNVPRERYFHPEPGVANRTYLDSGYTIADPSGPTQFDFGRRLLTDLMDRVSGTALPPPHRLGLCLAMMWTEPRYYVEDIRRVLGDDAVVRGADGVVRDHASLMSSLGQAAGIAGPCLGVDAACASSLYALDAALGFLQTGRADAMVVVGLNASVPLFMYLGFAKLRALSPKAEILPFSSDASGIVPSEAVAAILVEPLEQALAAQRTPLAIVRALGLSADGGDRSVFAPSPAGQRLAYERAYAAVDPATIDYIEAHGVATPVGDETELDALDRFFAPHRQQLPIGSVKALIGHTLPTAGLASIIKAIVMMREQVIPPHVPARPHRRLGGSCLRLPFVSEPWPSRAHPRRIGISAFGFGGSNAHLVLEAHAQASVGPARPQPKRRIAIVAVEAAMGNAHGCAAVADRLGAARPPAPFPWSRFSAPRAIGVDPVVEGHFFPPVLTIDGAPLRMGPAALARLDALQRVGLDLVGRTLDDDVKRESTAVVACSNLGGAISLQMARQYHRLIAGAAANGEGSQLEEFSTESISSSLSSMISGFPAFHFGLKGFHQTLAGGPSCFWDAISLSSHWLGSATTQIALIAGRLIKSPVDLDAAAAQPGEGCVVFLLEDAERCRARGGTPLAVLGDAPAGEPFEICQLDASAAVDARGKAQQTFGFLEEAAGSEAILRSVLTPGQGRRIIEVRRGDLVVQRLMIEKLREAPLGPLQCAAPLPVVFDLVQAQMSSAPPMTRTEEVFAAWQAATTETMRTYFSAQQCLAQLVARGSLPLLESRRAARHVVIERPSVNGREVSARLLVDESNPYFFDHPLDHVPGFLMLEGMLQLVERITSAAAFIRRLELQFKRFCEKAPPPTVRAAAADSSRFLVQVVQQDRQVATGRLEVVEAPPVVAAVSPSRGRAATAALVHKSNRDNVVIGSVQANALRDRCRGEMLLPRPGHALDEGGATDVSALYLLEAGRQFALIVAHEYEGIPLGLPMNLLSLRMALDRPLARGELLHMECARQPISRFGSMTLAHFTLELHSSEGRIGEIVITAQVVSEATYLRQRGRA